MNLNSVLISQNKNPEYQCISAIDYQVYSYLIDKTQKVLMP